MATFPILTAGGDTIVTADGFAVVVEGGTVPVTSTTTLLVLSDQRDLGRTDAVTLNMTTGAITAHIATPATLPYAASGDTVADGTFAVSVQVASNQVSSVQVFDTTYTQLLSMTALSIAGTATTNPNAPIASNAVDRWYIAINTTPSVVHDFTVSGLSGTTWTPTAHGGPIRWMAISQTGTPLTLYYTETGNKPIYRWDLTNNVALANFVTNAGTEFFEDIVTLATGDVLCLGTTSAVGTSWCVRRYNAAGTLQATYTLGVDADAYELPFLFLDYVDQTSFWVKAFTDATGHTATYYHIQIDDGSVLATFTVSQSIADGDGLVPSTCPELIFRVPGTTATTFPIRRLRRWAP